MKELSIEEKAKTPDGNYNAYTELINRLEDVKEAIKKQNYGIAMNVLCKPYPEFQVTTHSELKDSENENIRKLLIEAVIQVLQDQYCSNRGVSKEKVVAWLEKQGNLMKALQISNAKIGELIEKNYYLKEQLEKQGEQKTTIEMITPEESLGIDSETYNKIVDECIYGEQKPIKEHNACEFCEDRYGCVSPCSMKLIEEEKFTNKVEPKFKIEEEKWYVCTQTFVLRGKIVVIKGQTYQAEKDNAIKGEDGCLFIDKHDGKASDYFRLWTIQDAKDGDVLCGYPKTDYPWIGIFHNLNTEGTFNSYCFLQAGQHGKFCPPSEENIFGKRNIDNHISEDIVPATKEQRELLFQKMKESGYEWDAEKKELKKIEEKKDIYNKLTAFEFSLKHIIEEAIECGNTHNLKADADLLLRIARKTSWSEEDERTYKSIIYSFAHNYQLTIQQQEFVKSLKGRIQPTKEWSEEDIELLDNTIKFIEDRVAATSPSLRTYIPTLTGKEIPFLKSLKDRVQLKQEWSEEDNRMYKAIIDNIQVICEEGYFVGNIDSGELIKWLKYLKDRYTWRPSDEQMLAINTAINVIGKGTINGKCLIELQEQLKKLMEK